MPRFEFFLFKKEIWVLDFINFWDFLMEIVKQTLVTMNQ